MIINELGRIDIDARLIKSRSGDVLELAGGCVCHEVRVQSELWAAIAEVARRANPEVVVLETTGIAEPWSILDGLDGLGDAAPAVASGVVCAVDAEAGGGQIARHEEARAQIEAADRIVLTKLDLAAPDAVVALHRELARRNPAAERASFPPTDEATAELVPWLLDVRTASRARRRTGHTSTNTASSPPSPTATRRRCSASRCCGGGTPRPRLVRAKGFVHLAGEPRRGFLERAGLHTELRLGEPWGDDPPATEIVLIGEGLDAGAIRRQIWACRAQ